MPSPLSQLSQNPTAVLAWRDEFREELAAYAHAAWSGWMKYLFEKCEEAESTRAVFYNGPGTVIPVESVTRWVRQMTTLYAELPENEKDSDRAEADKILAIMAKYMARLADEVGVPKSK